jgi:hypothetical protein
VRVTHFSPRGGVGTNVRESTEQTPLHHVHNTSLPSYPALAFFPFTRESTTVFAGSLLSRSVGGAERQSVAMLTSAYLMQQAPRLIARVSTFRHAMKLFQLGTGRWVMQQMCSPILDGSTTGVLGGTTVLTSFLTTIDDKGAPSPTLQQRVVPTRLNSMVNFVVQTYVDHNPRRAVPREGDFLSYICVFRFLLAPPFLFTPSFSLRFSHNRMFNTSPLSL